MIAKARPDVEERAKPYPLDKSLFKGKDLELVSKICDFLYARGLPFEIRGSVVENARKGRPRTYRDIDILVEGTFAEDENGLNPTGPRTKAIQDLYALGQGQLVIPVDYLEAGQWERDPETRDIIYVGKGSLLAEVNSDKGIELLAVPGEMDYCATWVDNRFTLRQGRTVVDLCFEGNGMTAKDYSQGARSDPEALADILLHTTEPIVVE